MTHSIVSKFASTSLVVVGLCFSISASAIGFTGWFGSVLGQTTEGNTTIDDALMRMTEKMNRKMPQSVDSATRLDKVSAEPGHQIAYHYTMLNFRSKDINTSNFYKTFRPTLQKRVCANEDLKMFFRNRVTVAYNYQGADGLDIGKLAFSPKDCGYPG